MNKQEEVDMNISNILAKERVDEAGKDIQEALL